MRESFQDEATSIAQKFIRKVRNTPNKSVSYEFTIPKKNNEEFWKVFNLFMDESGIMYDIDDEETFGSNITYSIYNEN